jgi:nitronate monooxygenase
VDDFDKGVDPETLRKRYVEGPQDDPDRIIVWAGAGVGMMNKIQPAKVSLFLDFRSVSRI